MAEVNKKEGYRSILEMGPLLLFFGVNYFYGIMAGTTVLVVSTLFSLALSWYWFKNIPMMAAAGCVAVVFLGGLTIENIYFSFCGNNRRKRHVCPGFIFGNSLFSYCFICCGINSRQHRFVFPLVVVPHFSCFSGLTVGKSSFCC